MSRPHWPPPGGLASTTCCRAAARRRHRALALGLIIARLLDPAAKLATARMLDTATASHSLGEVLDLGSVTARELYATLDWLGSEQPFIEATLARRHLKDGALVLYDVTSTYLEGRCCPLAQLGYSRDNRGDRPQLVIGLLCAFDGCPVAVEVFDGNTGDPATLVSQIDKLKQRFGLKRVVLVGDRGMITDARIAETLAPGRPGLDHRAARAGHPATGCRRADRCNSRCSTSATWRRSPARTFPASGWWSARIRCWPKNAPASAANCWRPPRRTSFASRNACSGRRTHCTGPPRSARRLAQCSASGKWPSTSRPVITDDSFTFTRRTEAIAAEARLDGIYVIRTNLPAEQSDAASTVRSYKSLAQVERAFRCMKTVDLDLRPVFHWTAPRVRAHALLCMLAYYLEWHMRQTLAPMLFDDHDRAAAEAQRTSPVAKAQVSPAAKRKATSQQTDPVNNTTLPARSFRTLLSDLATLTRNVVCFGGRTLNVVTTVPTELQRVALTRLGADMAAL